MGALLIADYDLLDFANSPARLALGGDLGSPAAQTVAVAKLLLDGDVVSGGRYGNRSITLPIHVRAATVADVACIVSDLALAVAQPSWQMPWMPADDQPMVIFDCFRGSISQSYEKLAREDACRDATAVVTLTFAALPFARDSTPTVLAPAPPGDPVVIDDMEAPIGTRTSGGPWTNPYNEWRYVTGGAITGPSFGGDTIPSELDPAGGPVGGGAVIVSCPVTPVITFSSRGVKAESDYAPFTLADVLAAPVDLSSATRVEFYARTDSQRTTASGLLRPYGVGIPAAEVDAPAAADSIHPGTWALTLTDDNGATSTWLVADQVGADWVLVSIDMAQDFITADNGFRIGHVVAYRLRLYAVGVNATAALSSPELYATGIMAGDPVDLHNFALGPGPVEMWEAADLHVVAAGDADAAWPVNVAVTAGDVYSGRLGVRQPGFITAVDVLDCVAGVEWLDSGGASLGVDWGSPVTPVLVKPHVPPSSAEEPVWQAEPTCPNVTAPVGTTQARIRVKVLAAPAPSEEISISAARLVPGPLAWRYPYGTVPAVHLWLDNLVAVPAATGIWQDSAYAVTVLPAVEGVARTPISVALAAGDPVHRVLIARTPAPPPGFTPFLDLPAAVTGGAGPTVDATALTGNRYKIADSGAVYDLRFEQPARAYAGTYALLVRVQRSALSKARVNAAAYLAGDDAIAESVCGRTWGDDGDDATAWPDGVWRLLPIGVLTLPPRAVDGANSGAVLEVHISGVMAAGTLDFDMAVLVDLAGESVLLDLGGGAVQYVWLDAPEQASAAGTITGGAEPDRSDAVSLAPFQSGQAVLQLDAANDNALTVVLDRTDAGGTGQITYYSRWIGARSA